MICGAQKRTSNSLYSYLITDTYFKIEIKKRSRKRSWFVRYIRVTLWLAPKTEHWPCQCLRSAMLTKQPFAKSISTASLRYRFSWSPTVISSWENLGRPPIQHDFPRMSWLHSSETFVVVFHPKAVRNDPWYVQSVLQHGDHFVPRLKYLTSIDAF